MGTCQIGNIIKPKGFKGSMFVNGLPPKNPFLNPGTEVSVGFSEKFSRKMRIKSWKHFNNGALVSFEGISSDTDVSELVEKGIFVDEDYIIYKKRKVFPGEEIVGATVYDNASGQILGDIIEVWILPGNDVWLMKTDRGNLPLPVIKHVIKDVDIDKMEIRIELIPGLEDLVTKEV